MSRLTGSDYRGVLDVLREAVDVRGPVAFPERVLDALRRLVPCDVVAYYERIGGQAPVTYTGEPRGPMTAEIRDASKRYWHQCRLTPADGARKYSDYLSRRDFQRLDLYQEVARPLGVEDMFRLWLDPNGAEGARLEFDRPSRGFSERDREVLDVLLPHLKHFRRHAAARRRVSGTAERLTPREREVLELVAEGKTNAEVARRLWISPETVRKHLENVYEKLEVHTRTAAAAALLAPER